MSTHKLPSRYSAPHPRGECSYYSWDEKETRPLTASSFASEHRPKRIRIKALQSGGDRASAAQTQRQGPPLSWSRAQLKVRGSSTVRYHDSQAVPISDKLCLVTRAGSQVHLPLGSSGAFRSPLFRLRRAPYFVCLYHP